VVRRLANRKSDSDGVAVRGAEEGRQKCGRQALWTTQSQLRCCRELWGAYIREPPFAVNTSNSPYRATPQHFGTIWHPSEAGGIKKSKGIDLAVVSCHRRRPAFNTTDHGQLTTDKPLWLTCSPSGSLRKSSK